MKLEIRNLTKSFGDTEVLHGISFTVESGTALGLLGRRNNDTKHNATPRNKREI